MFPPLWRETATPARFNRSEVRVWERPIVTLTKGKKMRQQASCMLSAALRAFQVLRIDVGSLFWCDAMTAVRAVFRDGKRQQSRRK